ncbi:mechanosensitive ion channel family protein [Lutibacter sp. B2]|nr:mechanosensitive ion channel family protein [Lutibacter sp. B2]
MEQYYNQLMFKLNQILGIAIPYKVFTTHIKDMIEIILILFVMRFSIRFSHVLVNRFFENKYKLKVVGEENRLKTIKGIIKSVLKYTIYFIGFTPILEVFGISISSIIAAAGIGGIAIGFGAQSLVKDVITGFFILFENQFRIGDHIVVGDKSGIVEEMTLRVTTLKDFNGDIHIVPNGTIQRVTNKCRSVMRAKVDIGVAYEENIDHVINVLNELCLEIAKENSDIMEGPSVLGITNFGESDVVISITAKTVPMQQWAVEREIRKKIKQTFDQKGIEIPYPRRVIVKGN